MEDNQIDKIDQVDIPEEGVEGIDTLDNEVTPYSLESTRQSLFEEAAMLQKVPNNNWDIFKYSAENMFQDTTLGVVERKAAIDEARRITDFTGEEVYNPMLTMDEANKKYAQYGVVFNKDIRSKEAEVIAARKVREVALKQRLQKSEGTFFSGTSSLLGSFVGAMADPINIATAFIPVTKVIPALKGLEAMGAWGRTALKGIDGVVMNSLVEPAPLWMAGIDQRDYTMADTLFNITAGGVFGAGIGGLAEGVRLLGKGEKFNAGLAAAIEYANNRGCESIKAFQRKAPATTEILYDDLVKLGPDNIKLEGSTVDITAENLPKTDLDKISVEETGSGTVAVRLNDNSKLSGILGYGKNTEEAIINLRQKIGILLDDDSIYKGYRIDDAIDNFYNAMVEWNGLDTMEWSGNWLKALQEDALKAGKSFEDYLAEQTKNFTDFSSITKRAGVEKRKIKKNKARYGELSGDALDDLIEQDAADITLYADIKDAFAKNPRQGISYDTFMGDYQERVTEQGEQYNRYNNLAQSILDDRTTLEELRKQLQANKQLPVTQQPVTTKANVDSENYSAKVKQINKKIAKLNAQYGKSRSVEHRQKISKQIKSLEAEAAEYKKYIPETQSAKVDNTEARAKITSQISEIDINIKTKEAKLKELVAKTKIENSPQYKTIDKQIADLKNKVEDSRKKLENAYGNDKKDLGKQLKELKSDLAKKEAEKKDYIKKHNVKNKPQYKKLEKQIADLKQTKSTKLDELRKTPKTEATKQLDTRELTTGGDKLTKQINDLETSIKTKEKELNEFLNKNDPSLWKYETNGLDDMKKVRTELEQDSRTFSDVRDQLETDAADESGKTWDTSDSVLDDLSATEADVGDEARAAKLEEEIEEATLDIQHAIKMNKFTADELFALGIDKDGQSIAMKAADKRIAEMDEFSKAADDYAACRRTEDE